MKRLCCVLALLLPLLPLLAQAAGEAPKERQTVTEQWLQIQREGQQTTPKPQVATPSEREMAYQRWLDSFKHPIPDFYSSEGGDMGSR